MNRLKYMTVRVLQGLLVLLCIATVNFMLIRAAPGDPVAVIAGEAGASDPQFVAQLREQFGLDKPVSTQLATYLSRRRSGRIGFGKIVAGALPCRSGAVRERRDRFRCSEHGLWR